MRRELKITLPATEVSALLDLPDAAPKAALTLAHGAGAGMHHKFLALLSAALVRAEFGILRFQFPYMEAGRKMPDGPKVAVTTVAAAVERLGKELPGVPLFAGGKSFGCRMSTVAAAEGALPGIRGILCFGYPLHPPEKPGRERAEHLPAVNPPILFLQGDRDEMAQLDLLRGVCEGLPRARLHVVRGGDHSFGVLKSSGRTADEVLAELVDEAVKFRDDQLMTSAKR